MRIARTLDELAAARAALRGQSLGLVPTMGALHAGHLALVAAARMQSDAVAASIFVNPLQFGEQEDLARYPRDEAGDLAALRAAGVDLVWLPSPAEMYAPDRATTIEVAGPARRWEGVERPGHFRGVATVVAKLFGQIRPERAFFGEKDWQQLQVIRRMVTDLDMPVTVVGVPTVREPDGLALSSRNRFLRPAERALAPRLHQTLRELAATLGASGAAAPAIAAAAASLQRQGFAVDYLALVNAATLEPIDAYHAPARILAAARLGSVRLLDNIGFDAALR